VEHFPDIVKAASHSITLSPPPFFRDHHVQDRPVLAAVEAMERLAADTRRQFPHIDARRLTDIRFDKFLFLDTQDPPRVHLRMEPGNNGSVRSALTSRFKAPSAPITRTLSHAALTLGETSPTAYEPPLATIAGLTGRCSRVTPERIYRELVPFGPAYRNINDTLLISTDGALARVGSPRPPDPRKIFCLGSPYVLDAAFHGACVWCQRYRGVVAFPVAMDRRRVLCPTRLDEIYTARVVPMRTEVEPFVFDIFIYDDGGGLRETVEGVRMRDISGGRMQPPIGFCNPPGDDSLAPLRARVSALVLMERDALAAFAPSALTGGEEARLPPMAPRRASGYLSARLALKRLSRMLSGDGDRRAAHEIETVAADGRAPQCPLADGTRPFCSVSHDHRFTVAVAAARPVGVDVEPLSEKPLKAMHLYMDGDEAALVDRSPQDPAGAALRVWSAKEAAAKALGLDLAEAWTRFRVVRLSASHSRLEAATGSPLTVSHAALDGHLITLLTVEGLP
jgi:phosphopantetheinyl transferase